MTTTAAQQTWQDWLGFHPIERMAPTWAARSRDLYVTQGTYTRTLIVAELPPMLEPTWLTPFLSMGGDVTVSLQTVPLTTGEANRLLRIRRVQHSSDMLTRMKQGRIDDPDEAAALASATAIEAQVRASHAKLFRTALTLTLRAPTKRELADLEQRVRERLDTLQATTWPATWEHAQGFQDSLPLHRRLLRRETILDTTTLAYSFPFVASNVGMPAGPIWGVSLKDRRPLRYDAWNRLLGVEAPHVALLGPTGGGKSVLAWTLLCEQLLSGDPNAPEQALLVDPKNDYGRGVSYIGG